jgi:hypothetical protein
VVLIKFILQIKLSSNSIQITLGFQMKCIKAMWLVGWFVYSCCSHLEHRASVKRFVSLQFLNLRHSVGLLERVISPSQGRYLTQTQNKHKQTSMPQVRFEPMIPAYERAKTVHALDRAAIKAMCMYKKRYRLLLLQMSHQFSTNTPVQSEHFCQCSTSVSLPKSVSVFRKHVRKVCYTASSFL